MSTAPLFRAIRHFLTAARPVRPRRIVPIEPLQRLERRWVPSGGSPPAVVLLSATTRDSRSVTIDYQIDSLPTDASPLRFRVFRSADASFDPGDHLVGSWTAIATPPGPQAGPLDDGGQPLTALGVHRITVPLPAGLPPDPGKPFVVVVAGADSSAPIDARASVAFRKYTIGVVTHGALIHSSWKHGPPWQLQTAAILRQEGFDAVIPFNWTGQSSKPGRAPLQGIRLAHQVLVAASRFPAGAPVDVQFIGHSEGAVVNTQAIAALERSTTPELRAGYVVDTLLDPHAANNNVPGQGSMAGGPAGWLATFLVASYQTRAHDPPVYIPPGVDEAQVFYQHSPASRYGQIYNLWGQVPVPNLSAYPVAYYNLTGAGAVHSGNHGVALWYRNFVAPTLGEQAPLIQTLRLTGSVEGAMISPSLAQTTLIRRRGLAWGPVRTLNSARPTFKGTAAPDSKVRVYIGPAADLTAIALGGQATTDADGAWSVTTRPLRDGLYRAVAMSYAPSLRTRPGLTIVPMTPLGRFTIQTAPRS